MDLWGTSPRTKELAGANPLPRQPRHPGICGNQHERCPATLLTQHTPPGNRPLDLPSTLPHSAGVPPELLLPHLLLQAALGRDQHHS